MKKVLAVLSMFAAAACGANGNDARTLDAEGVSIERPTPIPDVAIDETALACLPAFPTFRPAYAVGLKHSGSLDPTFPAQRVELKIALVRDLAGTDVEIYSRNGDASLVGETVAIALSDGSLELRANGGRVYGKLTFQGNVAQLRCRVVDSIPDYVIF